MEDKVESKTFMVNPFHDIKLLQKHCFARKSAVQRFYWWNLLKESKQIPPPPKKIPTNIPTVPFITQIRSIYPELPYDLNRSDLHVSIKIESGDTEGPGVGGWGGGARLVERLVEHWKWCEQIGKGRDRGMWQLADSKVTQEIRPMFNTVGKRPETKFITTLTSLGE